MRGRYEDFRDAGANLVAIGMGIPEMAADFREKQGIPFPLLVDHTKQTYRALEISKGTWMDVMGPGVWARGIKNIASGQGQSWPKQDPKQLGGAVVIEAGGAVRYVHRATSSSDNAPADELLKHLP